jgi:hypothetical protein
MRGIFKRSGCIGQYSPSLKTPCSGSRRPKTRLQILLNRSKAPLLDNRQRSQMRQSRYGQ